MGIAIAAVVVGMVLVGIGVLLGRRMRESSQPVFGTPVATSSTPRPASTPTPSTGDRPGAEAGAGAGFGAPPLDGLIEGLRSAGADGELTDDEIRHLLPGAEITRQGDGVIVTSTSTSTSHSIQGPDGRTYDSIDDIPDPDLRERLRRMLGDVGE